MKKIFKNNLFRYIQNLAVWSIINPTFTFMILLFFPSHKNKEMQNLFAFTAYRYRKK